jgi:hypothetical protein
MAVLPTHRHLDYAMQIEKRELRWHDNLAPDGRIHALQCDLQLVRHAPKECRDGCRRKSLRDLAACRPTAVEADGRASSSPGTASLSALELEVSIGDSESANARLLA